MAFERSAIIVKSDLNTRKPVVEIALQDLMQFPVWEFAIDEEGIEGQDETWIRPVNVMAIAMVGRRLLRKLVPPYRRKTL